MDGSYPIRCMGDIMKRMARSPADKGVGPVSLEAKRVDEDGVDLPKGEQPGDHTLRMSGQQCHIYDVPHKPGWDIAFNTRSSQRKSILNSRGLFQSRGKTHNQPYLSHV